VKIGVDKGLNMYSIFELRKQAGVDPFTPQLLEVLAACERLATTKKQFKQVFALLKNKRALK
jgi:hypothetical protein